MRIKALIVKFLAKPYIKLQNAADSLVMGIFRRMKIKDNYIVLESQGDYTDNIRTFYDYLIENNCNKKYKLIWFVHKPGKYERRDNVVFVSRFHRGIHFKADYYASVAKFFVFSHPYWFSGWRKEQIVINTCHAAAILKKHVVHSTKKRFDYILCCSTQNQKIKQKNYALDEKYTLLLGMPRVDLMYQHKDCMPLLFEDYHGEKFLLSMETFKQTKGWSDSEQADSFAINVIHSKAELEKLDEFLGENNCILIVKIHHLQNLDFLKMVNLKNIRYMTDDDLAKYDIQVNQLLENADILFTDYSSVFYEFLIKDRPIGFLIGDINEYDRGFDLDDPLEAMPGEKIHTAEELSAFISNCLNGIDNYGQKRKEIRDIVFTYQDASNCERLYRWIDEH